MAERALAHIEEIKAIHPIEGKDRIVLAEIIGWTVIVQKDEYKVGDKTVYVEIDSILPEKEEFEFLRKKKFRIKTMKMGQAYSQGICFPLSILPEGEYEIGQDVTELIGITKYDPYEEVEQDIRTPKDIKHYPKWLMKFAWFRKLVLPKKQAKGFPDFISKTDETRIENAPFYLEDKNPWIQTEKLDGQSGTWFLVKRHPEHFWQKPYYEFGVCSRNLRIWNEDNSSYWTIARQYNIKNILEQLIHDNDFIAIQGECLGQGIQGNKYHINGYDMRVFNLIYPYGRIGSVEAKNIVEQFGLKFVPILNTEFIMPDSIEELRKIVHGKSELYDTLKEGCVFRSPNGQKSFKCVDPEFLLKYGE